MTLTTIRDTQLFLTTEGDGTPIILFHGGLGLDHTYLKPYFDTLTDEYQVTYYDHRGNGRSLRLDDYSTMTFDAMIDDADAVREHLGHDKVIIIGHSYGGFIAQKYAIKYGQNLKGLVLIDTVPAFDYQPAPSGTDEQMAAIGAAFTRPMEDDADWKSIWSVAVQMYFKEYDPAIGEPMDEATHYVAAAWNQANALLGEYSTIEGLKGVDVPTLAMAGAHDFITPPEVGVNRIASLMPNATAKVFENSGHYPFIEEQDAFFVTLRDWLGQL